MRKGRRLPPVPDRRRSARRSSPCRWLGASRSPGHWCLPRAGSPGGVRVGGRPLKGGSAREAAAARSRAARRAPAFPAAAAEPPCAVPVA